MNEAEPFNSDIVSTEDKCLTEDEKAKLLEQDKRVVSPFVAAKLEKDAQRNWDLFYKRNETRFFRDRHWTTREFVELISNGNESDGSDPLKILEVGCGVGNLIYPLIARDENVKYFFYACDFSPRAIDFVRSNPLYDERYLNAFQCDVTSSDIHAHIPADSLDIVTLIFVLSAIHPQKFSQVVQNLWTLLKPGGLLLFRDYGLYDMAQLRFKPGNKISENLYVRQDGTRSYYFAQREVAELFESNGFHTITNAYIHRRTLNLKEGVDVPRIFLQAKFKKFQTPKQ